MFLKMKINYFMKTSLRHSKRARVTLSVFKVLGIKSIYYL